MNQEYARLIFSKLGLIKEVNQIVRTYQKQGDFVLLRSDSIFGEYPLDCTYPVHSPPIILDKVLPNKLILGNDPWLIGLDTLFL